MQTLRALLILFSCILIASSASAQRTSHEATQVDVLDDGSLVVDGRWYESPTAWHTSEEFKAGGHRCATEAASSFLNSLDLGDKAASDCSSSSTTIKSEFEPANGAVLTIPLVFHVISKTDGTGNISDSLIHSQVDILNEDFRAFGGTPGAPGVDTKIQFVLATTDPDGNATTGIQRVVSDAYFTDPYSGYNDMKAALNWDPARYLNVYTNDSAGYLGYATFPFYSAGTYEDGIVLLHSSVGRDSPGGGIYNQGRTATHEVGHYLGLFHTFQSGCGSASSPYSTGDRIADTEQQQSPNYICPLTAASCGSPDPIHNYMNYTQDTCMDRFTAEQANRMRCSIAAYRPGMIEDIIGGVGGVTELTNGAAVNDLAGSQNSEVFFSLEVPAGASNLSFATSGGSGDVDLFVRFEAEPSITSYDCRPFQTGNSENCSIDPAQEGTYYVLLRGFNSYEGVSLVGSYTEDGDPIFSDDFENANLTAWAATFGL